MLQVAASHPVILYDGVCGLCNRLVQFVLRRDTRDRFRFAALQSDFARGLLLKHGLDLQNLESICLLLDHSQPSERMETRSTAAIGIFRELGTFWRLLADLLTIVPRGFRDWGYDLFARNRYRVFGKYDACPLPNPSDRHKFLDTIL